MFSHYIGIDYSGAQAPVSRLAALQVYGCDRSGMPQTVRPYDPHARNWCRKEIARYCGQQLAGPEPCVIGIDHGFSFPQSYFKRHRLTAWDDFLQHFCRYWATERDHMYVEFVRRENPPGGTTDELRLCEQWTSGAKSVFQFDVQGSVAKSTHAGLPWIKALRHAGDLRDRVHFWPFDGFMVPAGRSVVAEIYPALFKRRYPKAERSPDQQDAFAVAMWLKDMDERGALGEYFNPPLNLPERRRAQLEGWILGVR